MIKKNYKYQIKLDIDKDSWNWYDGCNSDCFGIDCCEGLPLEVVAKIKGQPKRKAYSFLDSFLKQKYIDEKSQIDDYTDSLDKRFQQSFQSACDKMVAVIGRPLYRDDFTIYLTTFPRCPYHYEIGAVYEFIGWKGSLETFLHELCHFQFIHYWYKNPKSPISKLSYEDFDYLKESLTMILDADFYPLISKPDNGYPMHKKFRGELTKFWDTNKNFDELVDFGLKILPKFLAAVDQADDLKN
ncbi:MAG: hypothetical protein WCP11_02505 [Candidatus Saccharibacteria bacterium]